MHAILEGYDYVTGAVRGPDIGYLIATDASGNNRDQPKSTIFEYDGEGWSDDAQVSFPVVGASICQSPNEQLIALSPKGEAVLLGSGDVHAENVLQSAGATGSPGALRAVGSVAGNALAVGMGRQVYRRLDSGIWMSLGDGLPSDETAVTGFEAIDGFSLSEIYAAGWNGEIFRFDGERWNAIVSPTNLTLTSICCATDGNVYFGGQAGILIAGRGDQLGVIEHAAFPHDIWSLAWLEPHLYLATMRGVFRLADGTVEEVRMTSRERPSTYHLCQAGNVLWSIGRQDVMAFDGQVWHRIA